MHRFQIQTLSISNRQIFTEASNMQGTQTRWGLLAMDRFWLKQTHTHNKKNIYISAWFSIPVCRKRSVKGVFFGSLCFWCPLPASALSVPMSSTQSGCTSQPNRAKQRWARKRKSASQLDHPKAENTWGVLIDLEGIKHTHKHTHRHTYKSSL